MARHQIDQEPGDQEAAGPLSGGLSRRGLIKGILGLGSAALLSIPTRKVWALDQSMMGGGRGARRQVMVTDECAVIGDAPLSPIPYGDMSWMLHKNSFINVDGEFMFVTESEGNILTVRRGPRFVYPDHVQTIEIIGSAFPALPTYRDGVPARGRVRRRR
jgi:hypothetical protein